jgi:hypothetical protein
MRLSVAAPQDRTDGTLAHDGWFPARLFRCPERLRALRYRIPGGCHPAGFIEGKEGGNPLEVDETKKKIREILSVRQNLSTNPDRQGPPKGPADSMGSSR